MSKLKVTTIANVADSESTDVTNVINGSAKAWVNFNGIGTVAIRGAFNVTSITDNGTGDYTVNFTNAFTDTNYAAVCNCGATGSTAVQTIGPQDNLISTYVLTTSFRLKTYQSSSASDLNWNVVSVFR